MLTGMIATALMGTVPLLLLGLYRTRWYWSLVVFAVLFVIGLVNESLIPSDLWALPSYTQMSQHIALIVCWVIFSVSLGQCNRAKQVGRLVVTKE